MALGQFQGAPASDPSQSGNAPALFGSEAPRPCAAAAASQCLSHAAGIHTAIILTAKHISQGPLATAARRNIRAMTLAGTFTFPFNGLHHLAAESAR